MILLVSQGELRAEALYSFIAGKEMNGTEVSKSTSLLRVFLVAPEGPWASAVRSELATLGAAMIEHASTGAKARERFAEQLVLGKPAWDIVLLDAAVLNGSTLDIVYTVRSIDTFRVLPIIVIEDDLSWDTVSQHVRAGASAAIRRPEVSEVHSFLRSTLEFWAQAVIAPPKAV